MSSENIHNVNIGERIRKLRKSLKLTQADFAEKLGLSQGFVCNVEKNRAKFTVEHIISIGNVFNVDTSILVQGEDIIVKELAVGYGATPEKTKAIKRIVVILEGMSEARVLEVLKYAEEKNELVLLQTIGRGTRK